jgi:hypothetical protein
MDHPYAINLSERHNLLLFLAGMAFAGALILGRLFTAISFTPPVWLDVPSTGGLYGLGYWILKRRAWRWRWFRSIGAVSTPILSGQWEGQVSSSFDEHARTHPVTVDIQQDWTDISVALTAKHSSSRSTIAAMSVGRDVVLTYEFLNEPSAGAPQTMHSHRGTARLLLSGDGKMLSGQYYSGRDRQNCGDITLTRLNVPV